MAKYHISPTTGRPNQCYAKRQCPFGGEADHYSSKDEARAAYEAQMSGETLAPAAKKKAAAPVEDTLDVTTWKPATVDEKLADLYGKLSGVNSSLRGAKQSLSERVARELLSRRGEWGKRPVATEAEVREALARLHEQAKEAPLTGRLPDFLKAEARIAELEAKREELKAAMEPLESEFKRRGGWNRAFLVSNGNGHVHKSMQCSTCFPTTEYHWVTDYSDRSEEEIVDAAGERACTVCYPTAPVSTLNKPTRLYTPEEQERAKNREARAAAAEAKKAETLAKALTPDGSPFKITFARYVGNRESHEAFKTERSAMSWLVKSMADSRNPALAPGRELDPSLEEAHQAVLAAVAAKHGKAEAEVLEEVEKRVAARVRADEREAAKYREKYGS